MKAYGVRKKDNDCCAYHAKYPVPSGIEELKPRKKGQNKSADKARKAKMRHAKIEIENE